MSVSDINNKAMQPPAQSLQLVSNLAQLATAAGTAAVAGATAGVGGAAVALIGAILMAFDDSDNKMRMLQTEIDLLGLDNRYQNILQRATDINAIMSSCRIAWRRLQDATNAAQPVDHHDADTLLDFCMTTLEGIVSTDPGTSLAAPKTLPLWFALRDWQSQVYFSTCPDLAPPILGFGTTFKYAVLYSNPPMKVDHSADRTLGPMNFSCVLVPDPRPDGLAFCHVSTLPAYLHARAVFLAVGFGLRDDFLKQEFYRNEIWRHANFLAEVHQKILTEGYVFLPMPPDPWGPSNNAWWSGKAFYQGCPEDSGSSLRTPIPLASPFNAPFGCIERFSGDYVVDSFTTGIVPDITSHHAGPLPRFYRALLIAALQSGKQLYRQQLLDQVRSTVNTWCQLLNKPALLPDPSFGDWSLRELQQIVTDAGFAVHREDMPRLPLPSYDPTKPLSLKSLLEQIADTRDLYMAPPPEYPSSFQYMLSLRPAGYAVVPPTAVPR